MVKLSAIIITKNEEGKIGRCLSSLDGVVDEIIVVDSGSSDKTIEIAKQHTDDVYFRAWDDDYAAQKNYALNKASGDWVLSVDADEEVSAELADELAGFIASGQEKKYNGMLLPRKNIIFGSWLKHGECWPDYQLRLFRRRGRFTRAVHEVMALDGVIGHFKYPIIHYSHHNIAKYIQVINKYTDMEVKALAAEKARATFWAIIAYPLGKFIKIYLLDRGCLDGLKGLTLALLMTYYSFLKRYKYWRKARTDKYMDQGH